MAHRRSDSIFDSFTLSPLPYPVILILLMVLFLLGISGFFTYESLIEDAEEQINWILLLVPVTLLLIIRWISSVQSFDGVLGFLPYDRRRGTYYSGITGGAQDGGAGGSPWGVLTVVVLLLVLVSFQSNFQDMWKP